MGTAWSISACAAATCDCEQQPGPVGTSRCEVMLGTQLEIPEPGGGRQGLPFASAPAPGRQCLTSAACQAQVKFFSRQRDEVLDVLAELHHRLYGLHFQSVVQALNKPDSFQ